MPVIIPYDLPAKEILSRENIFVMNETRAQSQDIRPLRLAIINLMPTKIETETQLLRMLSNTALQVNVDLIRTKSHQSKNTSKEHLEKFYKTFDEIRDTKYDGMIVTGAPVEKLDYEEVSYWEELKEIMDYARENVYSTMFICWASQAALYHYYGIKKYKFEEKLSGVFENEVVTENVLTRGFDNYFYAPQSRYTYCREEDLSAVEDIKIIAKSDLAGVHISATSDNRLIFISGHSEYDEDTLDKEYRRDVAQGINPKVPQNYYRDNDPDKGIVVRWKSHGNLLFSNWLNYCVYQETPYDIEEITKKVVAKFGGSSLADAKQFNKVRDIILSQSDRNHIVVSAPGKRYEGDTKVTDILTYIYKTKILKNHIQEEIKALQEKEAVLTREKQLLISQVEERFEEICSDLEVSAKARREINNICKQIDDSIEKDFIVSRGEYLNALIMADYLGYDFIDSADLIFFDKNGKLDEARTYAEINKRISKEDKVVVPGFYGSSYSGEIKTFERGGSDITGSIIAKGISADVYENWTDVTGVMTEDPKKSKDAKTIENLTYRELLQITKNGAQVYHPDAIKPVEKADIPINIKNTNKPHETGTIVQGE